jgi:hypothetical protein
LLSFRPRLTICLVTRARLGLTAATLAVALAGTTTATTAGGSQGHFRPCAPRGGPAPFVHYWLGESFEGHALEDQLYGCATRVFFPETVRAHHTDFIYGDCEAPCAPPLDIQTWPACDRYYRVYHFGPPGGDPGLPPLRRLRGVPAAYFGDGRLELYTGDVTVVVFAEHRAQAFRAAHELRAAPGSPGGPSAVVPLPPPVHGALSGNLGCGLRFGQVRVRQLGGCRPARPNCREVRLGFRLPRRAAVSIDLLGTPIGEDVIARRGLTRRRFELRPDRYRLALRAMDRKGRHTGPKTMRFRVRR